MEAKVIKKFEDIEDSRKLYKQNSTFKTDNVQRMFNLATTNNKRNVVIVKPDFGTFKKAELQEYATLSNVEFTEKETVKDLTEKLEGAE